MAYETTDDAKAIYDKAKREISPQGMKLAQILYDKHRRDGMPPGPSPLMILIANELMTDAEFRFAVVDILVRQRAN